MTECIPPQDLIWCNVLSLRLVHTEIAISQDVAIAIANMGIKDIFAIVIALTCNTAL